MSEVAWMGGRAALGQIARRRANHPGIGRERARHHGGIRKRTDADRRVDAFLEQVDHAVGEHEIDRDFGILLHEMHHRGR
jgi:plasmid stabilization system protein ParE